MAGAFPRFQDKISQNSTTYAAWIRLEGLSNGALSGDFEYRAGRASMWRLWIRRNRSLRADAAVILALEVRVWCKQQRMTSRSEWTTSCRR